MDKFQYALMEHVICAPDTTLDHLLHIARMARTHNTNGITLKDYITLKLNIAAIAHTMPPSDLLKYRPLYNPYAWGELKGY